ncbi:hypothetical protein Syun_000484 [Stephania yunnanensis]|uniref:Uncharacterized protein n=1 Tax=Stephania yunnanensis TaxID=152371 RepID=A0AAP0LG26_9MAGN
MRDFLFSGGRREEPGEILIVLLFFSTTTHHGEKLIEVADTVHRNRATHLEELNREEPETNISHILFGIASSANTWTDRTQLNRIWWDPNATRGFVWLDEPLAHSESTRSSPPIRVSEDTSRFKYSCSFGNRSAIRIARIVLESFRLGIDDVRWFVMGDDDTVFFKDNLVFVLSKYDHNQMVYVGGISECVEQVAYHSYTMGFGGGGFAISYPLAKELVRVLDGCIDRYHDLYGSDDRIGSCLTEIGIRVTVEPGFHQLVFQTEMDIRGSAYGLLAAHPMAPLVTVHHLHNVEPLLPNQSREESVRTLYASYKRDPARALQQSMCYDLQRKWSVSVSWGYTVQIYTRLMTAKELWTAMRTYRTIRKKTKGPFTFNTREVANIGQCEREVRYFVSGDVEERGKETVSYYRRINGSEIGGCGGVEKVLPRMVIVVAAKMDHKEWKKV